MISGTQYQMKKNNMKVTFRILILSLAFVGQVTAQAPVMDLNQCLAYGLEHSPYITLSKNEIEMFKYDKRDLISNYMPTINGSFDLTYNAKLATTVIPASDFGLGMPPGGGEVEDLKLRMGQPHSNTAVIQLEQKIYDHSLLVGMTGVKDYQELSQLNADKFIEDLLYNVSMAYYQVLVVDQQIELLEGNLNQYTELVRIMQLQLDKGVIMPVDFNRVKVANNNIKAQLSLMKANKTDVLNNLKRAMGMPLDQTIDIDTRKKLEVEANLPLELDMDISNRIDFRINMKNIDLQEINVRSTKFGFMPTLSGFARYGANSYGESLRDSWSTFYDFAAIGLSLKIPIFNGLKANTQYHKQIIQLENLKAQSVLQEEGFKMELMNTRTKIIEAHTSYSTNKENVELALEVYEQTNLAYQKGAASLSDFLNAEFSLKEAQTNYLTSLINMLSSRLDYEKSKGNLSNYLNNN